MSLTQIKELQEQAYRLTKEARSILDSAEKAGRAMNTEENAKWDRINADIDSCEKRSQQLQAQAEREARQASPANDVMREDRKVLNGDDHQAAFDRYIRRGTLDSRYEARDLGIGSLTVGPQGFSSDVINVMKTYNGPMQAGATIISTATGETFPYAKSDDTSNTGELLAENTSAASADATLSNINMGAYKFSSKTMPLSFELLNDAGFDATKWVSDTAGARLGRITNTYSTTGTGSSQPGGIVTGATTAVTAASATVFTADELIGLQDSLDPAYRDDPSTAWMFHSTTFSYIRKLKDSQNRYLLEPGLNGLPSQLLGKKYYFNNAMSSTFTTGQKLVIFGCMSKYLIRIVNSVNVLRSDHANFAKLQATFLGYLRYDAKVADATAFRLLVLA
jgi:HK97 family phage major capsid protein